MKVASRPLIHDLVQQTMDKSASARNLTRAAGWASEKLAETEEEKKKREEKEKKEKDACGDKMASVSTDFVQKLASALEFAAPILAKQASEVSMDNHPPVSTATQHSPSVLPGHLGVSPQAHKVSQPGLEQGNHIPTSTTAQHPGSVGIGAKTAGKFAEMADILHNHVKHAGQKAASDVTVSDATQHTGAPAPVSGPTHLVATNDAAADYTKREALAPVKQEGGKYLNEKPLSASTDKTLQEAFSHTSEAGAKIAARMRAALAGGRS